MDATSEQPSPLRTWSHATFRTVTFVVAVAALTHASGGLKDALGRLDTARGATAFLVLWTLTWFATRFGMRTLAPIEEASAATVVMQTTIAGGWNGSAIFAALVVYSVVMGFVSRGAGAIALWPVQFLAAVLGVLLAFVIGAMVGLVYGLVDAVIVGCGEWLYRFSSASASS
jgi:hypothetical protein